MIYLKNGVKKMFLHQKVRLFFEKETFDAYGTGRDWRLGNRRGDCRPVPDWPNRCGRGSSSSDSGDVDWSFYPHRGARRDGGEGAFRRARVVLRQRVSICAISAGAAVPSEEVSQEDV